MKDKKMTKTQLAKHTSIGQNINFSSRKKTKWYEVIGDKVMACKKKKRR